VGPFAGSLVLLSPSFSRKDESIVPRALDRLATVFGHIPFALALKMIGGMLKGGVPDNRVEALAGELQKNDPRFVRRNMHSVLGYYDRHGTLVSRFCASGLRAWVVFGENDDTKLRDGERRDLESCPHVDLVTIPGTGHFTLNTHPGRIAELILEAIAAATDPASHPPRPWALQYQALRLPAAAWHPTPGVMGAARARTQTGHRIPVLLLDVHARSL
jgi:pimeloyl-ACP methyl ester carboxylesterase